MKKKWKTAKAAPRLHAANHDQPSINTASLQSNTEDEHRTAERKIKQHCHELQIHSLKCHKRRAVISQNKLFENIKLLNKHE